MLLDIPFVAAGRWSLDQQNLFFWKLAKNWLSYRPKPIIQIGVGDAEKHDCN